MKTFALGLLIFLFGIGDVISAQAAARLPQWNSRTYYEILEVKPGSGFEEMRTAFRRLALKYHPDRNPNDPSAEEEFKAVAEAWSVLSDPQKRRAYDQQRSDPPAPPSPPPRRPSKAEGIGHVLATVEGLMKAYEPGLPDQRAAEVVANTLTRHFGTKKDAEVDTQLHNLLLERFNKGVFSSLFYQGVLLYWLERQDVPQVGEIEALTEALKEIESANLQWLAVTPPAYFGELRRQKLKELVSIHQRLDEISTAVTEEAPRPHLAEQIQRACKAYLGL